jgi:hypothetical protein
LQVAAVEEELMLLPVLMVGLVVDQVDLMPVVEMGGIRQTMLEVD